MRRGSGGLRNPLFCKGLERGPDPASGIQVYMPGPINTKPMAIYERIVKIGIELNGLLRLGLATVPTQEVPLDPGYNALPLCCADLFHALSVHFEAAVPKLHSVGVCDHPARVHRDDRVAVPPEVTVNPNKLVLG